MQLTQAHESTRAMLDQLLEEQQAKKQGSLGAGGMCHVRDVVTEASSSLPLHRMTCPGALHAASAAVRKHQQQQHIHGSDIFAHPQDPSTTATDMMATIPCRVGKHVQQQQQHVPTCSPPVHTFSEDECPMDGSPRASLASMRAAIAEVQDKLAGVCSFSFGSGAAGTGVQRERSSGSSAASTPERRTFEQEVQDACANVAAYKGAVSVDEEYIYTTPAWGMGSSTGGRRCTYPHDDPSSCSAIRRKTALHGSYERDASQGCTSYNSHEHESSTTHMNRMVPGYHLPCTLQNQEPTFSWNCPAGTAFEVTRPAEQPWSKSSSLSDELVNTRALQQPELHAYTTVEQGPLSSRAQCEIRRDEPHRHEPAASVWSSESAGMSYNSANGQCVLPAGVSSGLRPAGSEQLTPRPWTHSDIDAALFDGPDDNDGSFGEPTAPKFASSEWHDMCVDTYVENDGVWGAPKPPACKVKRGSLARIYQALTGAYA